MAPKKKDEGPKERPVLGRFRSNLKVSYAITLLQAYVCNIKAALQ